MAADPSIGRAGNVEQPLLELETRGAAELCNRYHRRVYAFCLAQLRNADEAADATQTTFVHALAALQRGVEPTFELGWLLAIARNVCRSRWESRRRRRHLEVVTDPQDLAELAPAHERSDRLAGIDDALARLPELQRRAVVLRDWQGLSYKEIAGELDVTLAAAETLIFRGRRALAHELTVDETAQRRSGLGSLLGLFKSGVLGGGSAAKVAVGAVAVVGISVAGSRELVRPAVTHPKPRVTAVAAAAAPASAGAAVVRVVAGHPPAVQARKARHGAAHRSATPLQKIARTTRRRVASPHRAGVTTVVAPRAEPPTATAPAAPAGPSDAPTRTPSTPESPAPTRAATPAAGPPPAARPPTPVPDASPAAPAPTPPATAPVTTPVTDTAIPAATTVTDTVQPVVTTVTDTAQPVVTTVTNTVQPVVTTVTSTVTPVVPTVTNVLPPLPALPPVHLP